MIAPLRLSQLTRVRAWMVAHKRERPLEYHSWDAVMTLWVMGATGWLPAVVLGDAWWGVPLCLLGFWMPTHYARWRARAHAAGRLRCDWLTVLTSATVRR